MEDREEEPPQQAEVDGPREGEQADDSKRRVLSPVVLASLPLQVALYYNVFYSFSWFIVQVVTFALRLAGTAPSSAAGGGAIAISDIFTCIAIAFWALCEPFRLYLGFSGNLLERVPQATAFALLTAFPQLPLWLYFITVFSRASQPPYAFGVANNILTPFFLIPELVMALMSIRKLVRSQAANFYLSWQKAMSDHQEEEGSADDEDSSIVKKPAQQAWVELGHPGESSSSRKRK